MATKINQTFTTLDVEILSGLTKTMLDYLVRTNFHLPSISGVCKRGQRRLYSFGDLVVLKAIKKLLEQGVSIKRLSDAFDSLSEKDKKKLEKGNVWHYIVTDGKNVYFKKESDPLVNLTKGGQLSFLFVIEIKTLSSELRDEVSILKAA